MKTKLDIRDILEKIKNHASSQKIILIILFGVLLLVITIPTSKKGGDEDKDQSITSSVNKDSNSLYEYEEYLENKLSKMLGEMEGAGEVKVMITFKNTGENILVSKNKTTENIINESDNAQNKTQSEKNVEQDYVYYESDTGNQPYVAYINQPEINGVIVLAQGAKDKQVASTITLAVEALLDVPIHKIQVLDMCE